MSKGKHKRPRRIPHSFAHDVTPADGMVILPPDMSIVVSRRNNDMVVHVTWPLNGKLIIPEKDAPSPDTYRRLINQLGDFLPERGRFTTSRTTHTSSI